MSEGNLERFRAVTEVFNAGDVEGFRRALDPDVEFWPDPRWPEPGPYRGREAVTRFVIEGFRSAWGEVELQVEELFEQRDAVVARCRWLVQGMSSGADVPVAFTLAGRYGADGLLERIVAFFDHGAALEWVEATAPAGD